MGSYIGSDPSPAGTERIAILTVNYGSHALLERNLAPLTESAPEITAVVCDNYTTQDERSQVRALAARHGWVLVESPINGGFGAGSNLAAQDALKRGATHLLLLNPDARIDAAGIRALADAVSADPSVIAAPALFDVAGNRKAPARHVRLHNGVMAEPQLAGELTRRPGLLPWLSAACLMVSATMWRRIGGFHEDYFLYWEDVELSFRAWKAGARLTIIETAHCVHDQGGTQRRIHASASRPDPKTPTFFYYSARNRLLFASRNLGPDRRTAWLWRSGGAAWFLIRRARGRRAALLHSSDAVKASARGVRDGSRLTHQGRGGTSREVSGLPTGS